MPDIETLATTAIDSLVAMCPRLQSLIDRNDKTPLTDGFIDLYRGLGRTKADWVGRVPVQVKGRSVKAIGRVPATYPIPRSDLAALRQHGTVLYFVVFVSPIGERAAHYAILSPFNIDRILNDLPATRKSAPVPLKVLPEDPAELEGIVGIALATQKQRLMSGSGQVSLDLGTNLTIHSARQIDLTALSAPLTISPEAGDFAIEVEVSDGILLPLPGDLVIYPPTYTEREVDLTVACGGVEYQRPKVRQLDEDRHEVKLSDGLTLQMRLTTPVQSSSLNLHLANSLPDRAKDIDFFLNVVALREITYNGTSSRYEITEESTVDDLRMHRAHLGKLLELFELLHVNPHLVLLEDIDDEQHKQLQFLYMSLVEGQELHAEDVTGGRVDIQVGKWVLMLLVIPGGSTNTWRYVDPFDPDNRYQFKLYREKKKGKYEEWPATAYDGVKSAELPLILNLRLDAVVNAYEAIAELPETTGLANLQVLSMIAAADTSEQRGTEFLNAATALNDWLIHTEGANPIHRINRWQIAERTSGLSREDRDEIRETRRHVLIERSPKARQLEASCVILLGDPEETEDCMSRLSEKERREMQTWPIWALASGEKSLADKKRARSSLTDE